MSDANAARAALTGRWNLTEFKREFSDTREVIDVMGPAPSGTLSVSDDGYVAVLITAAGRTAETPPEKLFATLMAYSGPCTVDAQRFITNVELAWHPAWVGTQQVRNYTIAGDELRITTDEQTHPAYPGRLGRGILVWRRAV
jgi:ribosomal protein L31